MSNDSNTLEQRMKQQGAFVRCSGTQYPGDVPFIKKKYSEPKEKDMAVFDDADDISDKPRTAFSFLKLSELFGINVNVYPEENSFDNKTASAIVKTKDKNTDGAPIGNTNAAGPHNMSGGSGKSVSGAKKTSGPYKPDLKGRDPITGNPEYSEETWEHLSKGAVSFEGVSFGKGKLSDHQSKHGPDGDGTYTEVECKNMESRARNLLSKPVGGKIDGYVRENGMIVRYNKKTNEIATGMPGKKIHTIHKLNQSHEIEKDGETVTITGKDYFDRMKAEQERKKDE